MVGPYLVIIYERLSDWSKIGVRILMAAGRSVTDGTRVRFRVCTPEEMSGVVASAGGMTGTVVLVRGDARDAQVLADAELLLDEEELVALRGWLDARAVRATGVGSQAAECPG